MEKRRGMIGWAVSLGLCVQSLEMNRCYFKLTSVCTYTKRSENEMNKNGEKGKKGGRGEEKGMRGGGGKGEREKAEVRREMGRQEGKRGGRKGIAGRTERRTEGGRNMQN